MSIDDDLKDRRMVVRMEAQDTFRKWRVRTSLAFLILILGNVGGIYYTYSVQQDNFQEASKKRAQLSDVIKQAEYDSKVGDYQTCTRGNELRVVVSQTISGAIRSALPPGSRGRQKTIDRVDGKVEAIAGTLRSCKPPRAPSGVVPRSLTPEKQNP